MLKYYFLSLFFLFTTSSFSQSLKDIKQVEIAHQHCLDEGYNMLGCSRDYYVLSDSLLNVTYNKFRKGLTADGKEKLKKEQLVWLKERDLYFKSEFQKLKSEGDFDEGSQDFDMVFYDLRAQFVMERVKFFISKVNN